MRGGKADAVIIGGTTEGRLVIEALNHRGLSLAVCVATELGRDVLRDVSGIERTQILVGRKDEKGFMELLTACEPGFVVDASHPFAVEVSKNIRRACEALGIPWVRYARGAGLAVQSGMVCGRSGGDAVRGEPDGSPAPCVGEASGVWEPSKDNYIYVKDACEAVAALQNMEGNILLTTGANTAGIYARGLKDFNDRAYIRVLDTPVSVKACLDAGISQDHIIAARPPFSMADNLALIEKYHIRVLVTKDSGHTGGVDEKLKSADAAGIPAVIIKRPAEIGANGKTDAANKSEVGANIACGKSAALSYGAARNTFMAPSVESIEDLLIWIRRNIG